MSKRNTLLTTAAAAALVGAMTSGAMAFDDVSWDWTHTVTTDIDVSVAPVEVGEVVNVEKLQTHFGDITANSTINGVTLDTDFTGTVDVTNAATAVANNQSITTDTALLLHDAQIGVGAINAVGTPEDPNWEGIYDGVAALIPALTNLPDDVNANTIYGMFTVLMAGNSFIEPAAISATANIANATGTTFDNAATAVTNNASWTVDSAEPSILVADLMQLGIADVSATAGMTGITLDGVGAGSIANAATAVGNNLNIEVNVPTP